MGDVYFYGYRTLFEELDLDQHPDLAEGVHGTLLLRDLRGVLTLDTYEVAAKPASFRYEEVHDPLVVDGVVVVNPPLQKGEVLKRWNKPGIPVTVKRHERIETPAQRAVAILQGYCYRPDYKNREANLGGAGVSEEDWDDLDVATFLNITDTGKAETSYVHGVGSDEFFKYSSVVFYSPNIDCYIEASIHVDNVVGPFHLLAVAYRALPVEEEGREKSVLSGLDSSCFSDENGWCLG